MEVYLFIGYCFLVLFDVTGLSLTSDIIFLNLASTNYR